MTNREQRIITGVETREVGGSKGRQFQIRTLPYDVVDTYNTRFRTGLFDQGYRDNGLPTFLYGHVYTDLGQVLGRALEARNHDGALEHTVELDDFDAVPAARQASSQLRSGTLRRFSIGFERLADEPADDAELRSKGVVDITEGLNDEVSIVLRAAVPGTGLVGVRSQVLTPDVLATVKELLDRGALSEERAKELLAHYRLDGIEGPPKVDGLVSIRLVEQIASRLALGELDLTDALGELKRSTRNGGAPAAVPEGPHDPPEEGEVPTVPAADLDPEKDRTDQPAATDDGSDDSDDEERVAAAPETRARDAELAAALANLNTRGGRK